MTEFDKAMKSLSDLLYAAARKSGEIFDNTKTSYNISVEKDRLSKLQARAGAKLYHAYKATGVAPEGLKEDLEAIRAAEAKIEEMEKAVAERRAGYVCVECGAAIDANSVYCPKCGAKQKLPASAEPSSAAPECEDKPGEGE